MTEQLTGDELKKAVEALLFASEDPVSLQRLSSALDGVPPAEVNRCIDELDAEYQAQGRPFGVVNIAGGYQLATRPEYHDRVRTLRRSATEARLSQAALETLAIVAYRQPVLRADIEAIRGVSCGEVLRSLMDRGLVKISGKADTLGKPILYGTTKQFLEVFGLADLKDLPKPEEVTG